LLRAAAWAITREGGSVDYCGRIPTPALVFHAMQHGMASLMVTGSHIPDDRNGIKFNLPWGEVLKPDETGISAHHARLKTAPGADEEVRFGADGMFAGEPPPDSGIANNSPVVAYVRRYLEYFPAGCLAGLHVLVYEHSSVARDVLGGLLEGLGARVSRVARSDRFIPVDTEAVQNPEQLAGWVRAQGADALVSADGDGDRPLVVDEEGTVVRGDVLGILVAAYLGADAVAAPVSCNTALEQSGLFARVLRTRIGSPFVVAALQQAVQDGARRVVGFEANGGFLLASEVPGTTAPTRLLPLPTRDAALPILAVLHAAARRGLTLSRLVGTLPARFTHSGLLRPFPTEEGQRLVAGLQAGGREAAERLWGSTFGAVAGVDFTDGVRVTFGSGDIVHIRPSGNAPEFRVYTESDTAGRAAAANATAMELIRGLAAGPA
jgi:phosphomannomutase